MLTLGMADLLIARTSFRLISQRHGVPLNDEKFGTLYGNHIRLLIRRRTGLSRLKEVAYGLWAKGSYTDTQKGLAFYTETIYTQLGIQG